MFLYKIVLNQLIQLQPVFPAATITKIHASITGAPTSFVHVVFHDLPATDMFTDSRPSNSLLIQGLIRAGRADTDKVRLAKEISASSSHITRIPQERILVIIEEVPARFAVEDGRIMPEPGMEDDWLKKKKAGRFLGFKRE